MVLKKISYILLIPAVLVAFYFFYTPNNHSGSVPQQNEETSEVLGTQQFLSPYNLLYEMSQALETRVLSTSSTTIIWEKENQIAEIRADRFYIEDTDPNKIPMAEKVLENNNMQKVRYELPNGVLGEVVAYEGGNAICVLRTIAPDKFETDKKTNFEAKCGTLN